MHSDLLLLSNKGVAPPERPVLFMKASSALAGPEDDIIMPKLPHGDQLDWEVELAGIQFVDICILSGRG